MKKRFFRCCCAFVLLCSLFISVIPSPAKAADPLTLGLIGTEVLPALLAWVGITANPKAPEVFEGVRSGLQTHLESDGLIKDGMLQAIYKPTGNIAADGAQLAIAYVTEDVLNSAIDYLYSGEKAVLVDSSPDLSVFDGRGVSMFEKASLYPYYGTFHDYFFNRYGIWVADGPLTVESYNSHAKRYNAPGFLQWDTGSQSDTFSSCSGGKVCDSISTYQHGVPYSPSVSVDVNTETLPKKGDIGSVVKDPSTIGTVAGIGLSSALIDQLWRKHVSPGGKPPDDSNNINVYPFDYLDHTLKQNNVQKPSEVPMPEPKPDPNPDPGPDVPGPDSSLLDILKYWWNSSLQSLKEMFLNLLKPLKEMLLTLIDPLVQAFKPLFEWLLQGIKDLFIPQKDYLSAKIDQLCNKFGFAKAIVLSGKTIKDAINGLNGGPPQIWLDLGSARNNPYHWGGKVLFLDLSWYSEYKGRCDVILGGFFWACFIWKVFKRLPGLISGASGDVHFLGSRVNQNVEDV